MNLLIFLVSNQIFSHLLTCEIKKVGFCCFKHSFNHNSCNFQLPITILFYVCQRTRSLALLLNLACIEIAYELKIRQNDAYRVKSVEVLQPNIFHFVLLQVIDSNQLRYTSGYIYDQIFLSRKSSGLIISRQMTRHMNVSRIISQLTFIFTLVQLLA